MTKHIILFLSLLSCVSLQSMWQNPSSFALAQKALVQRKQTKNSEELVSVTQRCIEEKNKQQELEVKQEQLVQELEKFNLQITKANEKLERLLKDKYAELKNKQIALSDEETIQKLLSIIINSGIDEASRQDFIVKMYKVLEHSSNAIQYKYHDENALLSNTKTQLALAYVRYIKNMLTDITNNK